MHLERGAVSKSKKQSLRRVFYELEHGEAEKFYKTKNTSNLFPAVQDLMKRNG